jgi:hypothetical protein
MTYPELGPECPRPEAIYYRALPDGFEICVYRMLFSWRVCFGEQGEWGGIIDGYCYRDADKAIAAASQWDGTGDAPDGWHKHAHSYRARRDGDPAREYDQRKPEPQWPSR